MDGAGTDRTDGGVNSATARRRWSRYSLRTLFVVMAVVGLLTWWVQGNVEQVRERERLLEWADANFVPHGNYKPPDSPANSLPIMWRLLGAKQVDAFLIDPLVPVADQERLRAAFPESAFHKHEVMSARPLPRRQSPAPLPATQ
jgi:hypothetical protein